MKVTLRGTKMSCFKMGEEEGGHCFSFACLFV